MTALPTFPTTTTSLGGSFESTAARPPAPLLPYPPLPNRTHLPPTSPKPRRPVRQRSTMLLLRPGTRCAWMRLERTGGHFLRHVAVPDKDPEITETFQARDLLTFHAAYSAAQYEAERGEIVLDMSSLPRVGRASLREPRCESFGR